MYELDKAVEKTGNQIASEIRQSALDNNTDATTFDGLDYALLGMVQNEYGCIVPVYSYEKMLDALTNDAAKDPDCEDPESAAMDWMDINIMGSMLSIKNQDGLPATPIIVYETADDFPYDPDKEEISLEIPYKFSDDYLRDLAINDHIGELQVIDRAIKEAKNSYTKDASKAERQALGDKIGSLTYHKMCERADLYLLLRREFSDKQMVLKERVQKFKDKDNSEKKKDA